MYNDKAHQKVHDPLMTTQYELIKIVKCGSVWACVDCFMESGFCHMLPESMGINLMKDAQNPASRYNDLMQCIHCGMYQPFWEYTCYNNWMYHEDGRRKAIDSLEPLYSFMRRRELIWGCVKCYAESRLYIHRKMRYDGFENTQSIFLMNL